MPRRRPQEYEARRLQIIEGALQVFSTRGFVQATNKDIAAAAGIGSPGLIYHYFKDKADLLRAVAEQHAPPMQVIARGEEWMALPPAEALTQLGLAYMRLREAPQVCAFLRLVLGEALRDPEFGRLLGEVGPMRILNMLADYMQRQMDRGVLRRMDPHLAARCFLGPIVMIVLLQNVLQLPDAQEIDPAALVAASVDVFLRGMQAEPGPAATE